MHQITVKHKFDLFDKAAKSSYLMYVFSLGIINEQTLFLQGGYSNFFEYTLDRFELSEKQSYKYLHVFNRLKDYVIDKSLSTPDELLPVIQHHPLSDFPLQKLYIISQLSDTKLRNLLTKGEVVLGSNQKFSLDKLRKLDRDRLLELITEPKPKKSKKHPVEINIDDIQISDIHSVEVFTLVKGLVDKISTSKLHPEIMQFYQLKLEKQLTEFSELLVNQFKPQSK